MFNKTITFGDRSLVSAIADAELGRIGKQNFRQDQSFGATLRALLHRRIPGDSCINFRFNDHMFRRDGFDTMSPAEYAEACVGVDSITCDRPDTLTIVNHVVRAEDSAVAFAKLDEAVFEKYERLEALELFFGQRGITARFYLSPENRCTIIVIAAMNLQIWHLLQAIIPRYLPWYFQGENAPTPDELALLKTLTNKYAPAYEAAIAKYADIVDYRAAAIRQNLTGYETRFDKDKLKKVERQMTQNRERYEELERQHSEVYTEYQTLLVTKLGLMEKIKIGSTESELMDFFLACKSINFLRLDGSRIDFLVATPINSFDPDVADSILKNQNSWLYNLDEYGTDDDYDEELFTIEESARLFRAIFIEETLRARTFAAFYLNFGSAEYNSLPPREYADEYPDFISNQHFTRYKCFGQNQEIIRSALDRTDYVGAVQACVDAAGNVAIEETTTTPYYWRRMLGSKAGKYILLPDNTAVTPREAVNWLAEQDAAHVTKKEEE